MDEGAKKTESVSESNTGLPLEYENILKEIPDGENRDQLRQMLSFTFAMSTRTTPQAELLRKMSPENLDMMLKSEAEEARLRYKDKGGVRVATIVVLLICAVFICTVIYLLKEHPDTLSSIIVPFITLIAGGLGGYGFGRAKGKRSDQDD